MPSPKLFLIAGPPRSGTTFLADWIGEAWPEHKWWYRESGVTKAIHEMVSALDFNRRDHPWGFDLLEESAAPVRKKVLRKVRETGYELYRNIGNHPEEDQVEWILDKEPNFQPDGACFYQHIREVFPDSRLLFTIRDYRFILNSMIRRDYTRGPYPRPNIISPYAFDAEWIENVNCDVPSRNSGERYGFLEGRSDWSFRKCCVNLRNAVDAIHGALPHLEAGTFAIVRYENLGDSDSVCNLVENLTGKGMTQQIPFSPTAAPPEFSHSENQEIERELVATGALERMNELETLADDLLA